jgi:hypothetical protein
MLTYAASQEARELKDLYKIWLQLLQTLCAANLLHMLTAPQVLNRALNLLHMLTAPQVLNRALNLLHMLTAPQVLNRALIEPSSRGFCIYIHRKCRYIYVYI